MTNFIWLYVCFNIWMFDEYHLELLAAILIAYFLLPSLWWPV